MTVSETLQRLKDGNARYMADNLERANQDNSSRDALTGGQSPFAIVLSCADSRVVPELAFDAGLGELFVVRVAGNVANTSSIASIEYAVAHLGTKLIVVMGHQSCGAVTAAVNGGDNGYNLNHLLSHITPAVVASPEGSPVDDIVKKNAELNVEALKNRSAILKDAVDNGGLKIVSAYYNLDGGKVEFFE